MQSVWQYGELHMQILRFNKTSAVCQTIYRMYGYKNVRTKEISRITVLRLVRTTDHVIAKIVLEKRRGGRWIGEGTFSPLPQRFSFYQLTNGRNKITCFGYLSNVCLHHVRWDLVSALTAEIRWSEMINIWNSELSLTETLYHVTILFSNWLCSHLSHGHCWLEDLGSGHKIVLRSDTDYRSAQSNVKCPSTRSTL